MQLNLRRNTEELHSFLSDLSSWEKEIDKKDTDLKDGKVVLTKSSDKPAPRELGVLNVRNSDHPGPQDKQKKPEPSAEFLEEKDQGNKYFKMGDFDNAVISYSKCIRLDPKSSVAYSNRAMAFIKLGNFKEAERDCTNAITLDRENVKPLYRRAMARRQLGDLRGAAGDLSQALKMDPSHKVVAKELKEVRALIKKQEEEQASKPKAAAKPTPPKTVQTSSPASTSSESLETGATSTANTAAATTSEEDKKTSPAPATTAAGKRRTKLIIEEVDSDDSDDDEEDDDDEEVVIISSSKKQTDAEQVLSPVSDPTRQFDNSPASPIDKSKGPSSSTPFNTPTVHTRKASGSPVVVELSSTTNKDDKPTSDEVVESERNTDNGTSASMGAQLAAEVAEAAARFVPVQPKSAFEFSRDYIEVRADRSKFAQFLKVLPVDDLNTLVRSSLDGDLLKEVLLGVDQHFSW